MALYEYRCTVCGRNQERVLPMAECRAPQSCSECGSVLERRISMPARPIVAISNRERVMKGINGEAGGHRLPGNADQKARYESVLFKGLDVEKRTVGIGI